MKRNPFEEVDELQKILVTGASGFIGKYLVSALASKPNVMVYGATRNKKEVCIPGAILCGAPDLSKSFEWNLPDQLDVVVHAAALAHISNKSYSNSLDAFRTINIDGTINLARQASSKGVKRFIFLSSIGVNGRYNSIPFTADTCEMPTKAYAISKLEAENALKQISIETGMDVVIIRPPLVYSFDAPGNFRRLLSFVDRRIPLPFGAIENLRSYMSVENLVDFIITCIHHQAAANQTFVVSDGKDISTREVIRLLGIGMKKPSRLFHVPKIMLKLVANAAGKRDLYEQLCENMQIDNTKVENLLGWSPKIEIYDALVNAGKNYKRK